MRNGFWVLWSVSGLTAVSLSSGRAVAQETAPGGQPGTVTVPSAGGGTVVVTPGSREVTTYTTPPPGYPQPGTDQNEHLPEGSRPVTDTSRSSDGFNYGARGPGEVSVRGGKGAS